MTADGLSSFLVIEGMMDEMAGNKVAVGEKDFTKNGLASILAVFGIDKNKVSDFQKKM